MKNPRVDRFIMETCVGKSNLEEKLKEIALEEVAQMEPLNQPGRRVKAKKKK